MTTPKWLITGAPGSGKTTLIRRLLACLPDTAQGFYTLEVRSQGRRVGFDIVTLDGERAPLARVGWRTPHAVGRYGVDLTALEALALPRCRAALAQGHWLVVDEIGPMELLSPTFRALVMEALASPAPLLATVAHHRQPFLEQVRRHPAVTLFSLTPRNRETLFATLCQRLKGAASP